VQSAELCQFVDHENGWALGRSGTLGNDAEKRVSGRADTKINSF